jgi:hypothetical protein
VKAAIALLLAVVLGSAELACGKYGKPVRSSESRDRGQTEKLEEPEQERERESER